MPMRKIARLPGFLHFRSSLPVSHHAAVDAKIAALGEAGHELPYFLDGDGAVEDAVRAMLGNNAELDECRHIHLNPRPGGKRLATDWHCDDYDGGPWPASYRWAMLFYFPQVVPLEMGPIAVRASDGREVVTIGPAGTCLLIRQDTVHRATTNRTDRVRRAIKYLFRSGCAIPKQ